MTTVALLADPPRAGIALPELVADGALTDAEAVSLYRAMVGDVCEAVRDSGGELLVNYRSADDLPEDVDDPEGTLRSVVEDALGESDDVRYEVQVGSTFAARAGNTVTHLLEREGVQTAAVVRPTAAFLGRQHVDSAAMKLRRNEVVLGPSTDGRVYYAGFADPIDFEDAFAAPAVETLVARANDADLDAGFLPMLPTLARTRDLRTAVPLLRARLEAGLRVPPRTAAVVRDLGLRVVESDGEPSIERL